MKGWLPGFVLLASLAVTAKSNEVELVRNPPLLVTLLMILQKKDDAHRQRCAGMYSRKSWGGNTDPFILAKFRKDTSDDDSDPIVSLVIFEWNDELLIGRYPPGAMKVGRHSSLYDRC